MSQELLITVSMGLYNSSRDKKFYVQIITKMEEHWVFEVPQDKVYQISRENNLEITLTDESFEDELN